ncbi:hypothetical protein LTR95_000055 [Oleoguttula sp. CCFEE 5521]
MFSRLSTNKQYFMEPTNGMRYYEDVHRPIIDPYDQTGDACESETDTEASESSESDQSVMFVASSEDCEVVVSPSKKRSAIANRAAPARKFTWLGRETNIVTEKKRNRGKAGKKDVKAGFRSLREQEKIVPFKDAHKVRGAVQKVRAKQNVRREAESDREDEVEDSVEVAAGSDEKICNEMTFNEFMEGVRQAVAPASLISDDDRGDEACTTERGRSKTFDTHAINESASDNAPMSGFTAEDTVPDAPITDGEYEILYGCKPDLNWKAVNSKDAEKEQTTYKISPSMNPRSSIIHSHAMRSPSATNTTPRKAALSSRFTARAKEQVNTNQAVVDLTSPPKIKSRKHRGVPYRRTLRPASRSLDLTLVDNRIAQSGSRSRHAPFAAQPTKQRESKRAATKACGGGERKGGGKIAKIPVVHVEACRVASGKRETGFAKEKKLAQVGGQVAKGPTKGMGKDQWVWFKNWRGERWTIEKSAGVVVIR